MHSVLFTLGALAYTVAAQDSSTLSPSDAATVWPSIDAQNIIGTKLYGFTGCGDKTEAIKQAYTDFQTLANQDGVKSAIDWKSAAALEFLGPEGSNKNQQSQIQDIFKNAANVYPSSSSSSSSNPFIQYIKVRCDDPVKQCTAPGGSGSCGPNSGSHAYSLTADPDDSKWPAINFCNGFFDKPSLAEAIKSGINLNGPEKYNTNNYFNKAETWFHEILRLKLGLVSAVAGPLVDGYGMENSWYDINGDQQSVQSLAYGPQNAKLLAKFQPVGSDKPTGWYVQQNPANLVWFAMTKLIQTKLDNVYPYLPLVVQWKLEAPWKVLNAAWVIEHKVVNGKLHLLQKILQAKTGQCNLLTKVALLKLGAAYSVLDYPADYWVQLQSWIAALQEHKSGNDQPSPPKCQSSFLTPDIKKMLSAEIALKVSAFCAVKSWWPVNIVPAIGYGSDKSDKSLGFSKDYLINAFQDKLWLDVTWKSGCQSSGGHSPFGIGLDDGGKFSRCQSRFMSILNGCDKDSLFSKYGGSVEDECLVYRLGAVKSSDPKPFPTFLGGPDFSCKNADTSINSSFANACSCYHSGEPQTTALFQKPNLGCSALNFASALAFQSGKLKVRDISSGSTIFTERAHARDVSSAT